MAIERKKDKYGNKMRHRGGALLRMTAAIVFWLLVWQLLSFLIGSELLLPSPWAVVRSFCGLAQTTEFYRSILHTLLRVAAGFAAGMTAGLLAGALTAFSHAADVLLTPLKNIIKATPVTSFIVLILLYFSSNVTPSAVAFIAVLPICWSNVCEGLRQTDKKMTELAHAYAFGRKKTLREIYFPAVRPYLSAAATTGLGFAWKSCVAAEVIALSKNSVGRALYESKLYLETAELFAWTASVVLISVLFEKLLVHKLFKNKNTEGAAGRRSESLEHEHASREAELQYKSDAYAEYGKDEERNI